MQARLLRVSVLSPPNFLAPYTYLAVWDIINKSIAFAMSGSWESPPSREKFSMMILLIFSTKPLIYWERLKGTASIL
jgi:hypothetical protein